MTIVSDVCDSAYSRHTEVEIPLVVFFLNEVAYYIQVEGSVSVTFLQEEGTYTIPTPTDTSITSSEQILV